MLRNIFWGSLIAFVLTMAPSIYAGKVELTTYYPAPMGEYQDLKATNSVEVGTPAVPGTFKLVDGHQTNKYVLTSDANGVGTWQANSASPAGWTCGVVSATQHMTAAYSNFTVWCPVPRKPISGGMRGWTESQILMPVQSGNQFGYTATNGSAVPTDISVNVLCCE